MTGDAGAEEAPLDPDTVVGMLLEDNAELWERLDVVDLRLALLDTRTATLDAVPSRTRTRAGGTAPGDAGTAWSGVDHDSDEVPAQLTLWVRWLVRRYGLDDTIPACWTHHGPLLEELAALAGAWHDAHTSPTASGTLALAWHTALDACLTRVRGWDRQGCASAGVHQPPLPALPREHPPPDER